MKKHLAMLFVVALLVAGLAGCDSGPETWLARKADTAGLVIASLQKGDVFSLDTSINGVMYVVSKDTASVTISSCAKEEVWRATVGYFAENRLVKYGDEEKLAVCPALTRAKVAAAAKVAPAKRPATKKLATPMYTFPPAPPTGGCSS